MQTYRVEVFATESPLSLLEVAYVRHASPEEAIADVFASYLAKGHAGVRLEATPAIADPFAMGVS